MIPESYLYLYEYKNLPEDLFRWKNDDDIVVPRGPELVPEPSMETSVANFQRLCVGVGKYPTKEDGEIYLCTLMNPENGRVESWSIGSHRSPELVERAVQRLLGMYPNLATRREKLILRSSQNPLYKGKAYKEIMANYPIIIEMTEPGTRGGVMVVSTFFSQLMIRKGGYQFITRQDGVSWLSEYVYTNRIQKA